jgi:hypothetical protein
MKMEHLKSCIGNGTFELGCGTAKSASGMSYAEIVHELKVSRTSMLVLYFY